MNWSMSYPRSSLSVSNKKRTGLYPCEKTLETVEPDFSCFRSVVSEVEIKPPHLIGCVSTNGYDFKVHLLTVTDCDASIHVYTLIIGMQDMNEARFSGIRQSWDPVEGTKVSFALRKSARRMPRFLLW